MSIEKDLSRIATALETIAAAMSVTKTVTAPVDSPAPIKTVAPNITPAAPVVAAAPVVPPVVPAPVPAAATPTVVAPSGSAPFTDAKGLMEYVMSKYKALGPIKGGEIQGVLTALGHKNINELKPEQYGEFHARVEAL